MRRLPLLPVVAGLLAAPFSVPAEEPGPVTDVAALAEELERLKQKLAELEPLQRRVEQLETELDAARARQEELALADADAKRDRVPGTSEPAADEAAFAAAEIEDGITLGGALRFNFYSNDFDETVESKRGDGGLDLFRLGADGRIDDFLLSAEYRFYSFMDVLHHGWIGYDFDTLGQFELGVTRVPFGLLPYASHNFWFGTPYYLGLSDDYDLGAKWVYDAGPWQWQTAFFKNAEFGSPANLDRYSYDVVAVGDTRNEESNQLNFRGSYTLGADSSCSHEIGLSGQFGEIYNADTNRNGDHWAAAAHLDTRCGRWNVQLQAARYDYAPENPPGVPDNVIRLGGFGTSYDVAAEASVLVANVAYNLPLSWEYIDQVTCYNDYSRVLKDEDGFDDSQLNTTGCLLGVGPLYVYFDLIHAENMVFFGDGSLAGNGEDGWKRRFNVNVGYYW
jgi:hypothetical protein